MLENDAIKPYKTVLTISTALTIAYLYFNDNIFIYISISISILCLLSVFCLNLIHSFWFKISKIIKQIMQPIILTIIYILIVTPLAILFRLFSKRQILDYKSNRSTMFIERNINYDIDSFKNPW